MTKIALLIGFQYDDDSSKRMGRQFLPGTLPDLYRMYKLILDKQFDIIYIVSDMYMTTSDMYKLTQSNSDIEMDIYTMSNSITPYQNKQQLQDIFIETLHSPCGFIYYSGHSLGTKLLLPGMDYISDTEVFRWMSDIESELIETLLIFDCCHGHNFLLPYMHDGNVYRLVNDTKHYFPHKIISLCASQSDQVSYSEIDGSYLTKSLFQHLQSDKPELKIQEFMKKVVYDVGSVTETKPKIYASYPNLHYIFPWLMFPISWKISFDTYHGDISLSM